MKRGADLKTLLATLVVGLAMVGTGCAGMSGDDDDGGCFGKCDGDDDWKAELDGRNDPIAKFLRAATFSDVGVLEGDLTTFLFGIAEQQGCGLNSIATFSISDDLLGSEPFPRLISVVCKDDDARASEFFIAASFKTPDGDVDLTDIEMFAWDADARTYRFYAATPTIFDPDSLEVEIEPARCRDCPLTPADIVPGGMRMTPIMNELYRPWTHWSAEPGFPSHDYVLPDSVKEKPNFQKIGLTYKAQASRLEEIIKFGAFQKTVGARLRDRRKDADLGTALDLLRPIFCSEQVNYISEDFDSGIIFGSALIDPGIRSMLLAIRPDWPYNYVNDQFIRLPAPTTETAMRQIPARGGADLVHEVGLVAVRGLTPYQVLRVRALDWGKAVFSDFRCGLWKSAARRFEDNPPYLGDSVRTSNALPLVFEAIMELSGQPLSTGNPEEIIEVRDATPDTVAAVEAALRDGSITARDCETDGFCIASADELAAHINDYIVSLETGTPREALLQERDRRICHVKEIVETVDDRFNSSWHPRFDSRPSLPYVSCR